MLGVSFALIKSRKAAQNMCHRLARSFCVTKQTNNLRASFHSAKCKTIFSTTDRQLLCYNARGKRDFSVSHQTKVKSGSKDIILEAGRYASLADGSATVRVGEGLVVLATAVHNKTEAFYHGRRPLTVDYRERAIAVGRIPNTQTRREGGFSDAELRISALVHRALVRPTLAELSLACPFRESMIGLSTKPR